jgi:hypothetical protein
MLIDHYPAEDVFARVPEVAAQTDPVLKTLDSLLEDDQLYQTIRTDLGTRYRLTLAHGRHSTPVEVILRLLLIKHLYGWSYAETLKRVADSLVLRWFCRVYFQSVPTKAILLRWMHTLRPQTLHQLNDRVVKLAVQAKVTQGPNCASTRRACRPRSTTRQIVACWSRVCVCFPAWYNALKGCSPSRGIICTSSAVLDCARRGNGPDLASATAT